MLFLLHASRLALPAGMFHVSFANLSPFRMKFYFERLVLPLALGLLFALLSACGSGTVSDSSTSVLDDQIRGEVTTLDRNTTQIKAIVRTMGKRIIALNTGLSVGRDFSFEVEEGDFGYLAKGKVFRANLDHPQSGASSAQIFRLSRIWPDHPDHRRRVDNVNRMLRRDTLGRGDDPTRTVGESLPPFALYDQNGNLLTTDFFDGKLTVMNFIFTRCSMPEMCPAATTRMRRLQNLVFADEVPDVQFLSITLDPLHDVPGILKNYAAAYQIDETNFSFGTARKTVIDDLVRQFGVSRKKSKNLPLDHTMRTIIINGRRIIVYQVPGKGWSADDFLARLKQT